MYRTTLFATTTLGNCKSYVLRDAYRSEQLAINGINILLHSLKCIILDSRRPESSIMKRIGFAKTAEKYLAITIYVEDMIDPKYTNSDMPKFGISNPYDKLSNSYSLEQRKEIWKGFVSSRFKEYTVDGEPVGPEYYCIFNDDVEGGIIIDPDYISAEDSYTPKYKIGDIVIDNHGDILKILDVPPMPYSILVFSNEYYVYNVTRKYKCNIQEKDILRRTEQ